MAKIKSVKIKDIGQVFTGSTPSTKNEDMWDGEYLFIKPSDISEASRYVYATETTLSEEATKTSKGRLLPKGTTCVVCIGTIGKICQLHKPAATNQQINSIVVNKELFDEDYIYYLMLHSIPKVKVVEGGSASGREHVKKSTFEEIELDVVDDIDAQKEIGRTLSVYDDLIENNNRRIAILETIAQNLYREWFINFRFPDHKQAQWQETPQGKIPVGWEVQPIAEEVEVLGGGTPRKSEPEYWDEELANINWFTPSDLTKSGAMFVKNSSLKITALGLQKSSAKLFPAYSVMMTSRATIGVISINTEPATTNQGFIICVPNGRIGKEYIYYWLKNNMQAIDNIATGATFKEVRRTLFRELPMLIPSDDVMNLFVAKVKPIFKLIENLINKNENLKQQRDMLLPKLITRISK